MVKGHPAGFERTVAEYGKKIKMNVEWLVDHSQPEEGFGPHLASGQAEGAMLWPPKCLPPSVPSAPSLGLGSAGRSTPWLSGGPETVRPPP